jgi:hypothetical protein
MSLGTLNANLLIQGFRALSLRGKPIGAKVPSRPLWDQNAMYLCCIFRRATADLNRLTAGILDLHLSAIWKESTHESALLIWSRLELLNCRPFEYTELDNFAVKLSFPAPPFLTRSSCGMPECSCHAKY